MIPKISLAAAFVLMMAPPMACASSRADSNPAPISWQAHQSPLDMVLAQDGQAGQPSMGTTDNDNDNSGDNDNDANDSSDDNQNADSNQTDQNGANEEPPAIPPTVLGSPEEEQPEPRQAPMNTYAQPANP
jgi:hypothetical protein